jgi:hypothetical protein
MYGINIREERNVDRIDEIFYGLKGDKNTGDALYFCKTDEVDTSTYAHCWFLKTGPTSLYDGIGIKVSNASSEPLYFNFDNDGFYAITEDNIYRALEILAPPETTSSKTVKPDTAVTFILDQESVKREDIEFILITTNYGHSVILLRWVDWSR